ncbi:MAG: hypothetical protein V7L04_12660 [Nostoc sp.]|uniref:hypothetical protein n=1 Tax=Nostoc sp. TaxID=1180 RepID=UPI002FFAB9CB
MRFVISFSALVKIPSKNKLPHLGCSHTLWVATPLILAALGELVTEKSAVLILGVEGMNLLQK